MPIEFKMPALSPTMEVGNLAKWHVKEGDPIEPGDVIAEIETDKATMEVESADEGVMGKIVVPEGTEEVAVGALIAVLLEEGEDASNIDEAPKAAPAPKAEEKAPEPLAAPAPAPAPTAAPSPAPSSGRIKASPLAKRLAKDAGIDLATLQGSGPGGRIVKADVEAGKAKPAAAVAPQAAPVPVGDLDPPMEEIKVNNVRKIVAARLTESKTTIPHYYLTTDANITKLLNLRKEINAGLQDEKVSVNDFIIKAVAVALMKTPEAHVMWQNERMFRFGRADVSVAVAIEGGLITPIIRNANGKPLQAISREMKALALKAREGKLVPEDYQGGTFSISNLGMFGIKEFSAVINPPQSGILAIGGGQERPVLVDGELRNETFMAMTGSFDHRAVDGAVGAVLMKNIKEALEAPALLLYRGD